MKIVLVGYMGSGKTSVGKLLAEELAIPFLDLDAEIENREEATVPQIFETKGEIYFRKCENLVLKEILSQKESFVLATGGGTPCYGDSLRVLLEADEVCVVYLKSAVSLLGQRLFSERRDRPLLAHIESIDALHEFVGIHLFERSHYYTQADIIVDTSDKTPQQLAAEIRTLL